MSYAIVDRWQSCHHSHRNLYSVSLQFTEHNC